MEIIEVDNIYRYLFPSIPVGLGKTSVCYLNQSMELIKVYRHNRLGKELINNPQFPIKLERISNLSNSSYIGPIAIVKQKEKLAASVHPFIKAPTLSLLDKQEPISNIFNGYDRLIINTKKISQKHFKLNDQHSRNILYDGDFYVIDLDYGMFDYSKVPTTVFHDNMETLFYAILRQIYGINPSYDIEFEDKDLHCFVRNLDKTNMDEIKEFQRIISNKCFDKDPSIDKVKRMIKASGVNYGYKKRTF